MLNELDRLRVCNYRYMKVNKRVGYSSEGRPLVIVKVSLFTVKLLTGVCST